MRHLFAGYNDQRLLEMAPGEFRAEYLRWQLVQRTAGAELQRLSPRQNQSSDRMGNYEAAACSTRYVSIRDSGRSR